MKRSEIKAQFKNHKSDLFYIIASIVAPFIGMLSSVVSARYVEPADLGAINRLLVILSYTSFLQLGVHNGLNRNIAYYRARKEEDKVQSMVDTSYFMTIVLSLILVAFGIGIAIYCYFASVEKITFYASLLLCVLLGFQLLSQHFDVTFRSGQEFKELGKIKWKESFFSIVCLILPALFSSVGYMISYGSKVFFGCLLRNSKCPFHFRHTQNWANYVELIKVGAPMMITGFVWGIFMVADVTFLSMFYSNEEVGLYNIATLCITAIMVIPNALNTLLYPKAAIIYGSTGERRYLRQYWLKSLGVFSIVMIPISVFAAFILPCFVDFFMPKYVGGIKCGQIALLSGVAFVSFGPSVIFGTIRKNWGILIILVVLYCLYWATLLLIREYYILSIESVAGIKLLFLFLYAVGVLILSYHHVR